ncbi:MAG: DNA polymerase III subunit chi [Gammaproteobacteria bacterium]|nr:DNA polymerase III subunit chi [Gammaproteobacteria bacterium]NIR97609.1 DNA polymerase III subunit chi [Gammaproteobacteria bacterium]NIT63259.1 DNA polymerase III subunit chi [Gammaproteobacteria bacterium]NIV20191.1 DNA polymerase III subunit chi [Gammaproteobacteria bacterium]NIY31839.1 DNA polymerase III subunit chi [Gammaproteobacteria bacterium]
MTRIDFYVVASGGPQARRGLACKLVEKAYKLGHRIYVHTGSAEESAQLDELLWTFRQGSFVPHGLHPQSDVGDAPVLIGHDAAPEEIQDVLVNLTNEVPAFFSRFQRVAELVDGGEDSRRKGRERFRFYRDRGYELQSHEL